MKTFKSFVTETRYSLGGGKDSGGGQTYHYKDSDGTQQSIYVPGKQTPTDNSSRVKQVEPKHPLHGKRVTGSYDSGQKVSGKLIGTDNGGKVAKIKDHTKGITHFVDSKTVNKE